MRIKLLIACMSVGGVLCGEGKIAAQSIAGAGGNGTAHSHFVCNNHKPMGCGKNLYGQLADGTVFDQYSPVYSSTLTGIIAVAGGGEHSLFLKSDSTVWGSGWNGSGQLGNGTVTTTYTSPAVQVPSLTGVVAVAAGWRHSLFLKSNGTVWASGDNAYGQLGDGTLTERHYLVQVGTLTGVVAIAAGNYFSLFLKSDGSVWACGENATGQFGNGSTTSSSTPVMAFVTNIVAIAAGRDHSLFLRNTGIVKASGWNYSGQLGDGTTIQRISPVTVASLTGVTAIAAGSGAQHSIFIKGDSTVWTCGLNDYGQLGDGTLISKSTPVNITSLSGIVEIAGGYGLSLFLRSDSTAWSCGYNGDGALGDGTNVSRSTVGQVLGLCSVATEIPAVDAQDNIEIYPNPGNGRIRIKGLSMECQSLKIYNSLGALIYESLINNPESEIDLMSQPKGIYFIRITGSKGRFINRKIIIE